MGMLEGALRESLEALSLKPHSNEVQLLLGTIYSRLPYSPYWVVFHWEQALQLLIGLKHKTLSQTLTRIRNQLGLSDPKMSINRSDEKNRIIDLLSPSLSPLIKFSLNSDIPFDVNSRAPQEILRYTIMLCQRLVLFPDARRDDIHYQLGVLFWKKENRLSAAVHHMEKAWDLGRQSANLSELKKLHSASLNFDNPK